MANRSKDIGTAWETACVDFLNDASFPWKAARTGSADLGGGDIHAGEWTIEAKAENTIDLPGYLKQLAGSVERSNRLPGRSVVFVKNRRHSTAEGYAVTSIGAYRDWMIYVEFLESLLFSITERLGIAAGD
jgi:hypothetical protein